MVEGRGNHVSGTKDMPRHYRMEVYGEMTFTNVDNQRTGGLSCTLKRQ